MSLDTPPTILEQANILGAVLASWAEPRGGVVKVMANMRHLWEEIYTPEMLTEAPRILIVYNGEVSRGGFNLANTLHRVDRSWLVVIMRGHGFKNAVAEEGPTPKEEPFYNCLEQLRDLLRTIKVVSEEFPIDYKSMKALPGAGPTQAANAFMDAYVIEFSTANDICAVSEEP